MCVMEIFHNEKVIIDNFYITVYHYISRALECNATDIHKFMLLSVQQYIENLVKI